MKRIPKFVALLIFKHETPDKPTTTLYDETIILVEAENEEKAREKVLAYGKRYEHTSINSRGRERKISLYRIVDITGVLQTESNEGGVTDIYARHFKNIKSYLKFDSLEYNPDVK